MNHFIFGTVGAKNLLHRLILDKFFLLCLILIAVLGMFIIFSLAQDKGYGLAKERHKEIHSTPVDSKPFQTATFDYLSAQNTPITVTGTLIQSSESMFALHTDQDDVLLAPASRLVSIRYHEVVKPVAEN